MQIVRGAWNENYINELETTQFNKKSHDDQADATSDSFYCLNKSLTLPMFNMSALQSGNAPVSIPNFLDSSKSLGSNFTIPTFKF